MLSTSVLVLNRLYQPVHVTSVRRALILLYRGAAKAVDEQYQTFDFESWAELSAAVHEESIGTTRKRIRVPRVILLQAYDHLPRARVRYAKMVLHETNFRGARRILVSSYAMTSPLPDAVPLNAYHGYQQNGVP